jgi:hypothetical protein
MAAVAFEDAASLAAVRVVLFAVPGLREREEGAALTPDGRPLIAIATVPEKPFTGTAFTLITCPVPPATRATDAGDTVSEKSAAAAGVDLDGDPPPQERRGSIIKKETAGTTLRSSYIRVFRGGFASMATPPGLRSFESELSNGLLISAE